MSEIRSEKITCPKCKHEGRFTVWNSINIDLNPELKDDVANGNIFKYTCSECGSVFNIDYDFLYHDMKNKFMIWYISNESDKKIEELADKNTSKQMIDYKLRIVKSRNDLLEKIKVFEDDLDDMIIEALKILILKQLSEEKQDNCNGIYYSEINKDVIDYVIIIDGKESVASMPLEPYQIISNDNKYIHPNEFAEVNVFNVNRYLKK